MGPGAVLTGSARLQQEARDRAEAVAGQEANERREGELRQEQAALQAQMAALRARLGRIQADLMTTRQQERRREGTAWATRGALGRARQAD